ncbi:MAG: heme-binding protein [Planctomycetia bacterium]|nr:heme-binding protein [Planctomycetia bacterium]
MLAGNILTITGNAATRDHIQVSLDGRSQELLLIDFGRVVQRFDANQVNQIIVNAGTADDIIRIDRDVLAQAIINANDGNDRIYAGGGPTTINAGNGNDVLHGGPLLSLLNGEAGNDRLYAREGATIFDGGTGNNILFEVKEDDTVLAGGGSDKVLFNLGPSAVQLTAAEVEQLLDRAAAATPSEDGIIAIVDRGGRILGVRTEDNVNVATPGLDAANSLIFAIDGALALARTGAMFGNNQAPLTSRTIQFISQSTITEREVNSSPDVPGGVTGGLNTLFGPGYVAPIGVGGHFPPNVPQTPQVDLFAIEHTNRDSSAVDPGTLTGRFNVANSLTPPVSFGVFTGDNPDALPRGIATLPGGIPIYKNGFEVGGIGVFYPGATGYASESNSSLSADYDPTKLDRSFEAEYVAFAALGGTANAPIGTLGGVANVAGISLPSGRIDLVGITLDIFGPGGRMGVENLVHFGQSLGTGVVNGTDQMVARDGEPVEEGFIVPPTAGSNAGLNLSIADINRIINQGIAQANVTRAAIRLPAGTPGKFVFAISDLEGNVLAIFRQPDATTFSLDVAVAKARNVSYYANPALLQPEDRVPGVPAGVAMTNRTFRYLAEPRYPEGIDGEPPGPFSILTDGGANPFTGLQVGPPLPADQFTSVLGYDSFNIGTNFRNPLNPDNQNGVVFFPGAVPLYKFDPTTGRHVLVGGLGVSGDGVDQDDVVTAAAARGYEAPDHLRADQYFFRGVRLPYQKFNRNPEG